MPFNIEPLAGGDFDAWVALRTQLWPHYPLEENRADAEALLARGDLAVVFVAKSKGSVIGFAEATLRVNSSTAPARRR